MLAGTGKTKKLTYFRTETPTLHWRHHTNESIHHH